MKKLLYVLMLATFSGLAMLGYNLKNKIDPIETLKPITGVEIAYALEQLGANTISYYIEPQAYYSVSPSWLKRFREHSRAKEKPSDNSFLKLEQTLFLVKYYHQEVYAQNSAIAVGKFYYVDYGLETKYKKILFAVEKDKEVVIRFYSSDWEEQTLTKAEIKSCYFWILE